MKPEQFRWLAGVIAAFPGRRVVGRTRLQKTVKLLQRLGLPTDYSYTIHFYGPYSEGVNSDLRLLEQLKLVHEQSFASTEGIPYCILTATQEAILPEMQPFQPSTAWQKPIRSSWSWRRPMMPSARWVRTTPRP